MHLENFKGKKDGEELVCVIRKHWIMDVKIAGYFLAFGLLPVVIFLGFVFGFWPNFFNNARTFITLIFLIYFSFVMIWVYISWLNEELDVMLVTNFRVINLDQVKFLDRSIAATPLGMVQDVYSSKSGFFQNHFDFGTLRIQTASERNVISILDVIDPEGNAAKILRMRDKVINARYDNDDSTDHTPLNPENFDVH